VGVRRLQIGASLVISGRIKRQPLCSYFALDNTAHRVVAGEEGRARLRKETA
jgi:hypothetical protein